MDKILILDFGSQYTQLIARRIREIGVYCEIYPYNANHQTIQNFTPKAIILSGGPESVNEDFHPKIPDVVFEQKVPILGICYGLQALCSHFGGQVESGNIREFGRTDVQIIEHSELFDNIDSVEQQFQVWMSHSDSIITLPHNFKAIACSRKIPVIAMADKANKIYGLQFHPEVSHTMGGLTILQNFVVKIAGCKQNWQMKSFLDHTIRELKDSIGGAKVICALSGGIDSTVVANLVERAIGEQLTCIFIDTGLLRHNEALKIKNTFSAYCNLICIDAKAEFYRALKGITDPEQKRKAIGKTFIEIFEKAAKDIGGAEYLAQGTIYPDIIESTATMNGKNSSIKSHHNVGGLPERLNFRLVEPLKQLFKDEVRNLAKVLNIPEEIIKQHPFPGPGLAVRIIGEVTPEKCEALQHIDHIFMEELKISDLYDKIWQAFAVLLPVKSVGVMGDNRTHKYVCALRSVTSLDGMTADFFPLPYEILGRISNRIVNEVTTINRVVYDITSKPPATIEWE